MELYENVLKVSYKSTYKSKGNNITSTNTYKNSALDNRMDYINMTSMIIMFKFMCYHSPSLSLCLFPFTHVFSLLCVLKPLRLK